MKPSVYIETTVISYLTAWPSRDLIRLAHQEMTRCWWDRQRPSFDLYTSQLVLIEAASGDSLAATRRLEALQGIPLLDITREVLDLGNRLIQASALPQAAERDAVHVAVAAAHGMDFLLTWNCKHLANAMLRDRIEQVCDQAGVRAPKICTPDQLSEEEL